MQSIFSYYNGKKFAINKKKFGKFTYMCKWIKVLLNNWWVEEYISREIRKDLEMNENKNITYQNRWHAGKAVLIGKLMDVNAYIKREKKISHQ